MNMINIFLLAAGVIFVFMCTMFVVATFIKNNSIADIGWGAGFALVALTLFFFNQNQTLGLKIITAITVAWGLRLSIYLFIRNAGKPEDWRYANWRKEWGSSVVLRSFFQVFMLQGAIMYLNVLPVIVSNASQNLWANPIPFFAIGFSLWLIGFLFETIGDWQMYRFKNNAANKGKVMNSGLWRYSRHPNYFGEALLHWGIFIVSIPFGFWYISIAAPIAITYLLLKVSGVVMLEKKYEGNDAYSVYKRTTSPFIPMPPKQNG